MCSVTCQAPASSSQTLSTLNQDLHALMFSFNKTCKTLHITDDATILQMAAVTGHQVTAYHAGQSATCMPVQALPSPHLYTICMCSPNMTM